MYESVSFLGILSISLICAHQSAKQSVSQSVISRSRPALTPPPAARNPAPPLPIEIDKVWMKSVRKRRWAKLPTSRDLNFLHKRCVAPPPLPVCSDPWPHRVGDERGRGPRITVSDWRQAGAAEPDGEPAEG